VAALSLYVFAVSSTSGPLQARAAEPSARVTAGANAAAESIAPDTSRSAFERSAFEDFASDTMRRLNDGAARLQAEAEEAVDEFGRSITQSTAEMNDAWADTVGKFQALQGEAQNAYDLLEERTLRGIEQFQRWLAGDQTKPRLSPRPLPPEPIDPVEPTQGSGPPIAV